MAETDRENIKNNETAGTGGGQDLSKPDKPSWLYKYTPAIIGWLFYGFYWLRVIKGKNNLPDTGGYIVASNHISFADPIFLRFAQKRQIHYMAKAELFKNPVTRWFCKKYEAFPVERGSADSSALDTAVNVLDSGRILGIFPEGTRSKDGKIMRGKSGTIYLAYHANKPIYPCAVYAKHKPLVPFSRYTIAFGEPVTVQELGVTTCTGKEMREATRKLMEIIEGLQDECRKARK